MAERKVHYHYRTPRHSIPAYCQPTRAGAHAEHTTDPARVTCAACRAKLARYVVVHAGEAEPVRAPGASGGGEGGKEGG